MARSSGKNKSSIKRGAPASAGIKTARSSARTRARSAAAASQNARENRAPGNQNWHGGVENQRRGSWKVSLKNIIIKRENGES